MGKAFYPQVAVVLNVLWEDFQLTSDPSTAKETTLNILARNVRVNINDYSHADTFEAEIDYKSFPFDPRLIRSCGVTVHLEDMGKLYEENNQKEMIRIEPKKENTIFQGFADEESIQFSEETRTVRIEGRDFTSLFLDRKYPVGTVNLEQTADQVINTILSQLPENVNGKIKLDNRVGALPVLASFFGEKDKQSGRKNVRKDETYWEVIQDIASRAGLIAYIELDKLVLSKPRVLYDKTKTVYFVYGKNVRSLEFKRKIGRKKNFNIVVRSLNLNTKEVIEAKIPAEATDAWSNAVGIPNKEVKVEKIGPDGKPIPEEQAQTAPYLAFSVPNVVSKDHLIEVAQQIYEEIGRQEIEGSLETRDMETWHFNADTKKAIEECFNLLKLRIGTPISIEVENSDIQAISRISSVAQRKAYLISQCYTASAAEAIARALGRISTPFYTKAIEYQMDAEQGLTIKVEFLNFIETPNKGFTGRT